MERLYKIFLEHPEVHTDSRKVTPGSLFFALRGENFNGNQFAATAIQNGASFAVIDEPDKYQDKNFILVENVLKTLQNLANHHRKTLNIPVVAITGTNGKTTTKELIYTVLARKFSILATSGNLNNHIGVPLTLLRLTSSSDIAVIEMGANHPGEIGTLCRIAEPSHGLITNVGRAHLEGFGSLQGVIDTKTELYRYLESTGGTAFINAGDPVLTNHSGKADRVLYDTRTITFKEDPGSSDGGCLNIEFNIRGETVSITSGLFGRYNADNIMAACTVGNYFGVDTMTIKEAIATYQPGNNRSQMRKTNSNLLILDMYNANPSSMELALRNFAAAPYKEKTLILGDMLELGEDCDSEHQLILKLLSDLEFREVYLIGPIFTRLNAKREWLCFQDVELAHLWLDHHRLVSHNILIKGSRGMRLETLLDLL